MICLVPLIAILAIWNQPFTNKGSFNNIPDETMSQVEIGEEEKDFLLDGSSVYHKELSSVLPGDNNKPGPIKKLMYLLKVPFSIFWASAFGLGVASIINLFAYFPRICMINGYSDVIFFYKRIQETFYRWLE